MSQVGAVALRGDLKPTDFLDAWIGVDEAGKVTVYTGKAELGQGIRTALMQVAAEQLAVRPEAVTMVMASTAHTPNEGYTAGSNSMTDAGNAIANAAAQVRHILIQRASEQFELPANVLSVDDGVVRAPDGRQVAYGELVKGRHLHVEATGEAPLLPPSSYKIVGKSVPRLDIPAKVMGEATFVHDLRPAGMLHARVVRPPNYASELISVDVSRAEAVPGVVKIIRQGSFLAVVASGEFQCILAMRALQADARWTVPEAFEPFTGAANLLKRTQSEEVVLEHRGNAPISASADVISASYSRPYLMHGSIGPSCAVAVFDNGTLKVWTHSQGVFFLRASLAKLLEIAEEKIECIHTEGAGCYGHNGADDAAADAAIIACAMPGRPIRVQWMREDEHGWEPYGSPMCTDLRANLGPDGSIAGWDCDVWSLTFTTRPGGRAENLLAAWHLPSRLGPPKGFNIPFPSGGGTNAVPYYKIPSMHVAYHYVSAPIPPRTSALRSLGGVFNVFAAESFMDELADAAHIDPVAFRLKHIDDPRGRDVILKAAQEFGWEAAASLPKGRGRGFAYVHFETDKTYCAVALEIEVDAESGRIKMKRAVAAVDCGTAVNPDGIRNQIQGCVMQSGSWALHEAVSFDSSQILSRDWNSYPILRFDEVPDEVTVHIVDRPGEPFLGTGEAGMGPVPAAIANALKHATGVRMRDLPLTADRVREALFPLDQDNGK